MEEKIPFSRPYIRAEEEEAVLRVLRSGWLTTAQETLAFEREFAAFFEADAGPLTALAVNSATSGLHLALEACGIGPGDIVLVPSYTFTSTAEVIRYLGAEPVFIDVGAGTFHLDPAEMEKTLERLARGRRAYAFPRGEAGPAGIAKAVMPVHYGGLACDPEVFAVARRYNLKVIEDAAHAFPCRTAEGAWAGTIGSAGVFSFYATKTITTGEGGMILTRNPEIAERVRIMRSHGIDRTVWNRYTDAKASWYYEVIEAGYKYNLPDLLSALGRVQLGRAEALRKLRCEMAARYDEAFKDWGYFSLPPTAPGSARHLYPLRLNLDRLSISRNAFIEELQSAGIGVSVHFIPLHTMPYYRRQYLLEDGDFPGSMDAFSRVISLPLWPGMSSDQLERV
ncbi:MAG: DegT/DnrJ/EryC1/StrS aminotransferase family protein, partial [Spirochaetaceae bacterium]|nr:DegT/DnrJ/EryC1/StrS aminotransferase family protein [Spirochaetaceae bacterium]